MAIAIAGTTTYENTDAATGYTLPSYTPAAGSDRILVVRVHALRTNESGAFTVDSVTFGGVALTQAVSADTSSSSRRYRAAIWYLINPSGSAGNIVVTLSHQAVGCIIAASTLTGAAQSSPVGQTGSNTTSPNASIASTEMNSGAIGIVAVTSHCNNNPTWTIYDSAGYNDHTEQYDIRTASNVSTEVSGAGGSVIGPDTVTNHRLDQSQSNPQVAVLAVFKVASGGSPVTVELDTLGATAAAVSLSVVPGAVSILLDTLAHLLAAVDLTVVPGGVAVVLTALDLDAAAVDLAVVPGAVAVVLTTLSADGAAVSFTVVPGAVDIPLDTLALLGMAVSLTVSVEGVDVTVVLATLAHSLSAVSLAVVPGAVTITLDTLAALLAAIDLGEVESVIGSALIIQLMTLAATLTAVPLTVAPGGVTIELQTLAANLSLQELIVFLLLGCAATGDRALFDAAAADFARYVAVAADRTGCA